MTPSTASEYVALALAMANRQSPSEALMAAAADVAEAIARAVALADELGVPVVHCGHCLMPLGIVEES
jgi:hypothetical protein